MHSVGLLIKPRISLLYMYTDTRPRICLLYMYTDTRFYQKADDRIKPEELSILSCEKGRGRRPKRFSQLRKGSTDGFN